MMRSRPPSRRGGTSARGSGGLAPGATPCPPRGRLATTLGLTGALSLCTVAACALFVPGFVFGAESSAPKPGPEVVVESTIGPAATSATSEPQTVPAPTVGPSNGAARSGGELLATTGTADPAVTASAGSLLVTLPWGDGEGAVGLAQPSEGLTRGPEALAVAPDGRIAVLDSVNKRLLLLDSAGQVTTTAPVPLAEPRFLAVNDDRLYVLDCDGDRRLVTLDWTGAECGTLPLPNLPDVVTGLFASSRGPCVEVTHSSVFLLARRVPTRAVADLEGDTQTGETDPSLVSFSTLLGRPVSLGLSRQVAATFSPGSDPRLSIFRLEGDSVVSTKTVDLDMAVPDGRPIEYLVSVDANLSGGLIVGAQLLDPSGAPGVASLLLRRFALADDGTIEATPSPGGSAAPDALLLAASPFAYVGQPYLVAPDGRVFQPVPTETGYSIFVHTFAGVESPAETGEGL